MDGTLSFSLLLDNDLRIKGIGKAMRKLLPESNIGKQFYDFFDVNGKQNGVSLFSSNSISQQIIYKEKGLRFKVDADKLDNENYLLLLNPIFNQKNKINESPWSLEDFPAHSLQEEYIFMSQLQNMSIKDAQRGIEQQKEIKRLSAELNEKELELNRILDSTEMLTWNINLEDDTIIFYPILRAHTIFNKYDVSNSFTNWIVNNIHPDQQKNFITTINSLKSNRDIIISEYLINYLHKWQWFKIKAYSNTNDQKLRGILELRHERKLQRTSIMKAQYEERKKLSWTLHDLVGQNLIGLRFMTDQLAYLQDVNEFRKYGEEINRQLLQMIRDTRVIVNNLSVSAFEEDGLKGAFESLVSHYQKVFSGNITLQWIGGSQHLDPVKTDGIFMTFQELLSNAFLHSKAEDISIEVKNDVLFELVIKDNGEGFDYNPNNNYSGLFNVKQRIKLLSGSFKLASEKHRGTTCTVIIQ